MKNLLGLLALPLVALGVMPGSPNEVRQAVAASHTITVLSSQEAAQIATSDGPWNLYPVTNSPCITATQCVFGDTTSHRTVVLYGDSHALMWLPAMDRVAKHDKLRLVVIWEQACPVMADVGDFAYATQAVNPNCSAFHTSSIALINSIHPVAVVLGERTAGAQHLDGTPVTKAQWQTGLVKSIKEMKVKKVAILEDIVFFRVIVPTCLAANPTAVQNCSASPENPGYPGQQAAEQGAAKATKSTYVKTWPWFCATTCSPIVGRIVVYYDEHHVSATYSVYLSDVLRLALTKVL